MQRGDHKLRFGITRFRRRAVPQRRLRLALRGALAEAVHARQLHHRRRVALARRLAEIGFGHHQVLRHAVAAHEVQSQIVPGARVAGIGRLPEQQHGALRVALHAGSRGAHQPQGELRVGIALGRRLLVPARRRRQIDLDAKAVRVQDPETELGRCIALLGRQADTSAAPPRSRSRSRSPGRTSFRFGPVPRHAPARRQQGSSAAPRHDPAARRCRSGTSVRDFCRPSSCRSRRRFRTSGPPQNARVRRRNRQGSAGIAPRHGPARRRGDTIRWRRRDSPEPPCPEHKESPGDAAPRHCRRARAWSVAAPHRRNRRAHRPPAPP